MDVLHTVLVIAHSVGAIAIVVGAIIALASKKTGLRGILLWSARVQLVTGVILAILAATSDEGANWPKLAVKLVVALAVAGMAEVGVKRGAKPLFIGALVLGIANIAVAVAW